MKRTLTLLLFLAACATPPQHIKPAEKPTGPCDPVALENAIKVQGNAAATDVVMVLLVGVPVSRIAGADRAEEIAQLKGNCHAD